MLAMVTKRGEKTLLIVEKLFASGGKSPDGGGEMGAAMPPTHSICIYHIHFQ